MTKLPRLTLVEEDEAFQSDPNPDMTSDDACSPAPDDRPPAEHVGQELRSARELKGKSLKDVSRVLKIRTDYLAAMEEGNFVPLPDRAHTLGFTRSYAAYLGLNAKDIVGRMKAEMAAMREHLDEAAAEPVPQPERAPQEDGPPAADCADGTRPAVDFLPEPERESRLAGRLIAVAMLTALIYAGYIWSGLAVHTALKAVDPVPERLALAEVPQQQAVEQAPLVVEQPAPVSPPGTALPSLTVLPPTQPVAVPAKVAPKVTAPLPPGRRYGTANKTSRILLRVHRATRVTVEGNRNRLYIDRILEAGDTYRVPNIGGLKLSARNAGAVEFILDGSSMGFAGKDGVTAAGLSLNPQNIIARRQHG
jgi:cytoskeleton protein RodZ